MPTVVEGVKGRAKLFDTLQRTGAHFIAVGSGSSCDDESDINNEDIENHDHGGQQEGELDGLSATASSKRGTRGKQYKHNVVFMLNGFYFTCSEFAHAHLSLPAPCYHCAPFGPR